MRKWLDDIEDQQIVDFAQEYVAGLEIPEHIAIEEWAAYAVEVMQIVMLTALSRDFTTIDMLVETACRAKGRDWAFRNDLLVDAKDALLYGLLERQQDRSEENV